MYVRPLRIFCDRVGLAFQDILPNAAALNAGVALRDFDIENPSIALAETECVRLMISLDEHIRTFDPHNRHKYENLLRQVSPGYYHENLLDEEEVKTKARIPLQNPLICFGASKNGKLQLVPSLQDANGIDEIKANRSEMLAADGPLETLKAHYAHNPNSPQTAQFEPLIKAYDVELAKPIGAINFSVLYLRGLQILHRRKEAVAQVAAGEWSPPETEQAIAIAEFTFLHGLLIRGSGVGRKLLADARDFNTNAPEMRVETVMIAELCTALIAMPELFEPHTAELIGELCVEASDEPQPARGRVMRNAFATSVLVLVGGGITFANASQTATNTGTTLTGGAGAWVAHIFGSETIRKSKSFKHLIEKAAASVDTVVDGNALIAAGGLLDHEKIRGLVVRLAEFAEHNAELIWRIGDLRPEFRWILNHLPHK